MNPALDPTTLYRPVTSFLLAAFGGGQTRLFWTPPTTEGGFRSCSWPSPTGEALPLAWVSAFAGWILEIVKCSDAQKDLKGFVLMPRRWVVERTFAWLYKFRRLSKDYEETSASSEAWIRLAMINVMTRRLTHSSA